MEWKRKLSAALAAVIAMSSSEEVSSSDESYSSDPDSVDEQQSKKAKITDYMTIIHQYTDTDFKSHFRLTRTQVEMLICLTQQKYVSLGTKSVLSYETALLTTIWCLANQECFRGIADRFGLGKGNCHEVVMRVMKILYNERGRFILWPNDYKKNVDEFNQCRGQNSFPGVIGCVDGTHIPIPGSGSDNSYYNRKGFHSVILQGVCNAKLQFMDIFCGFPGSCHDANVWKQSPVYELLKSSNIPADLHLLGDSAYPLDTFLMCPFRDNGHLTNAQKKFNVTLSSTRVVIEMAYGRLKQKFRRLKYLQVEKVEYAKYYIMAACVLHNVCIDEDDNQDSSCSNASEDINADSVGEELVNSAAKEKRLEIMQNLL
ncbi:putative nuclease HARBI1 [Photinus pyralis]|uniref:putative nuclease HARBI1 n=1 Tax=Photinus pyralis TaxID=7054 RepID=UPI00126710D2|nr:putative nuclease HARBI1 [Photinus pyralis]